MPPLRPSISSVKAMKTERTHEENQERAYVAASRRSDRSLEARLKSAGRASEIHRRWRGRTLRVAEQNVRNEEMYEQEYDDVPTQYLRQSRNTCNTYTQCHKWRAAAYAVHKTQLRQPSSSALGSYPVEPRNNGLQCLFDGPNPTLMAPPLETRIDGFDPNTSIASPQSSYSDSSHTKQFGCSNRGSDSGYGGYMLKRNFNGSGNITPQDVNLNSVFTFPKALQEEMLR
ncbi:hypothetical protein LTR29_017799 [Friedmanniomyces endolithicus]|nr:hypothetical protein LTR29_017799 [Friedmanniomyces endolithicus]